MESGKWQNLKEGISDISTFPPLNIRQLVCAHLYVCGTCECVFLCVCVCVFAGVTDSLRDKSLFNFAKKRVGQRKTFDFCCDLF